MSLPKILGHVAPRIQLRVIDITETERSTFNKPNAYFGGVVRYQQFSRDSRNNF